MVHIEKKLLCFLYLIVYGWVWGIITTMEESAKGGIRLLLQPTSFLEFLKKKNQITQSLMGMGNICTCVRDLRLSEVMRDEI